MTFKEYLWSFRPHKVHLDYNNKGIGAIAGAIALVISACFLSLTLSCWFIMLLVGLPFLDIYLEYCSKMARERK